MSRQFINSYYNQLHKIKQFGGSRNEGAISRAFAQLLDAYAQKKNLMLVEQVDIKTPKGNVIRPDGVVKNAMRLDFGFWEAKKGDVDLDREIQLKIDKGYPLQNILFEDSNRVVLYQENQKVLDVALEDDEKLDEILTRFIEFEPLQIQKFNDALGKFKEDIPDIVENLRELMTENAQTNENYRTARDNFLALCQAEINPEIAAEDIREMMIQHILTEDIFNAVFDETGFHRENNVAKQLEAVIETFMTRSVRQNYLSHIKHYYQAIRDEASGIADHNEKQKFLKIIYEEFYKVYNPKGADRLGVVYTPNEIVRFMIESTDYLLEKHFNKYLHEKDVEILDPATGTGTFITDLIDYISPNYLEYKYKNEIHANEVAILPYYIANLNIEFTYQQKMGDYAEFENICFVDTLDNTDALDYIGKQTMLFGLSSENAKRIAEQNKRKISVVIGNPPYNANQANFNDFNSNRAYTDIDKRIKETFVRESTAQKTKVYDMYSRFYRWAMDRVDKNGIIAFVTNRSFIDSRTYDGFRKCVQEDFEFAYIIDTRSDVRANPKIAGTTHNVFGIQTGVAIMFLVRKAETRSDLPCKIYYTALDDFQRKEDKLDWLKENKLKSISFETINHSEKNNWIDLGEDEFDSFLPLISKNVKNHKSKKAIFSQYSLGVSTNRDEWITDFSSENLTDKMSYFVDEYEKTKTPEDSSQIKWSRNLKRRFSQGLREKFNKHKIKEILYRPYFKKKLYYSPLYIDEKASSQEFFSKENKAMLCRYGERLEFSVLATDEIPGLNFYSLEVAQAVPLYTYDSEGNRHENITDWALARFRENYEGGIMNDEISKQDIFHYVYAVLHDPNYRAKYELNLKRDFPRIPFYKDFRRWAQMGKDLMNLHINYEQIEKYALERKDIETENPKPKLKADKENGVIYIDSNTTLRGVPEIAWQYKLGNRSALEWILDQYKEKKPKDATIAEHFNNYRFADYKEQVIELLQRVCTVSVKTMEIIKKMNSGR